MRQIVRSIGNLPGLHVLTPKMRRLLRRPGVISRRDLHPVVTALQWIALKRDVTIVQLGAYVGNSYNDPLYNFLTDRARSKCQGRARLNAVLVEPVKEYFDKLCENYAGLPGIRFENVAIAGSAGDATIYRLGVDPVAAGYPEWMTQLSSLKKERMGSLWEKEISVPELREFFLANQIQETVACVTFSDLMLRNSLSEIDLLQIDVEGFEFEILSSIDFNVWPIRFINYESTLLQDNRSPCDELLKSKGFILVDFEQDTFAFRHTDKFIFAPTWTGCRAT